MGRSEGAYNIWGYPRVCALWCVPQKPCALLLLHTPRAACAPALLCTTITTCIQFVPLLDSSLHKLSRHERACKPGASVRLCR